MNKAVRSIPTLEQVVNPLIAHLLSLGNNDAAWLAEEVAMGGEVYEKTGDDSDLVNAIENAITSLDSIGEDVWVYAQALEYADSKDYALC